MNHTYKIVIELTNVPENYNGIFKVMRDFLKLFGVKLKISHIEND